MNLAELIHDKVSTVNKLIPDNVRVKDIMKINLIEVDALCNIKCSVHIEVDVIKKFDQPERIVRFYLRITSNTVIIDEDCNNFQYLTKLYLCDINLDAMKILLDRLYDDIGELKYDTVNCVFYLEKDRPLIEEEFNKILKKLPTITMKPVEPCCVCYNPTKSLTMCNHSLCIPCADIMLEDAEDFEEEGYNAPCPICRQLDLPRMKVTETRGHHAAVYDGVDEKVATVSPSIMLCMTYGKVPL